MSHPITGKQEIRSDLLSGLADGLSDHGGSLFLPAAFSSAGGYNRCPGFLFFIWVYWPSGLVSHTIYPFQKQSPFYSIIAHVVAGIVVMGSWVLLTVALLKCDLHQSGSLY